MSPSTAALEQNICLIRLSAIGDVINTASAIANLQEARPQSNITWIIGSTEYELVKHLSGIEFILFDKAHKIRAYLNVKQQIANKRFDVLLLMQYSICANLLSLLVHATKRVGYRYPRSHELHKLFINHPVGQKRQHVVDSYLAFINTLGITCSMPKEVKCYTPADTVFTQKYIDSKRKTLLISPCASEPVKQWSADRYAAVADYASTHHGMQIIICGDRQQSTRHFCDQIKNATTSKVVDMVGKTNLNQLCALIAQVDILLSPDSAAAHIASVFATPTIGLYAVTNPERAGPYNSLKWCINRYPDAVQTVLKRTPDKVRWGTKVRKAGIMKLITVQEVCRMLDQMHSSSIH